MEDRWDKGRKVFASKAAKGSGPHAMTLLITFGFEPLLMTIANEIDGKELVDATEGFLTRIAIDSDEITEAIQEIRENEGISITR